MRKKKVISDLCGMPLIYYDNTDQPSTKRTWPIEDKIGGAKYIIRCNWEGDVMRIISITGNALSFLDSLNRVIFQPVDKGRFGTFLADKHGEIFCALVTWEEDNGELSMYWTYAQDTSLASIW